VEVILLQRVPHLGDVGSKVTVKPGFARNYLVPTGKAEPATKVNLANFELRREALEKEAKARLEQDLNRAATMTDVSVIIKVNAGHEGRLFGSVGANEIAKALNASGHAVAKQEVRLQNGPIRQIGEYEVELHFQSSDIRSKIKVVVSSES
jgi:large subunit ribosomal protein L9